MFTCNDLGVHQQNSCSREFRASLFVRLKVPLKCSYKRLFGKTCGKPKYNQIRTLWNQPQAKIRSQNHKPPQGFWSENRNSDIPKHVSLSLFASFRSLVFIFHFLVGGDSHWVIFLHWAIRLFPPKQLHVIVPWNVVGQFIRAMLSAGEMRSNCSMSACRFSFQDAADSGSWSW